MFSSNTPITDMTIILPCAGEGSRLGLDHPKELYEIFPGTRLIDFSLNHIRAFIDASGDDSMHRTGFSIKVAAVIRPWKQEVSDYIAAQLPGIPVEPVMFDDSLCEWPGSVFSAAARFSPYNLVLLPDSCLYLQPGAWNTEQVYCTNDGQTLIQMATEALNRYGVVFGAVPCTDAQRLSGLGAMYCRDGRVVDFQDKPRSRTERFNSFWGCYAFRKEWGEPLYRFLIASVRHQSPPLAAQDFAPPGAVALYDYHDLGTWENIRDFRTPNP